MPNLYYDIEAVYATPESDPLSYYQISGIHGMVRHPDSLEDD